MGSNAEAWILTYPPKVEIGGGNPETLKYGELWKMPEYRKFAPGEYLADSFMDVAKPPAGASVIDFGCGTGRGAYKLAMFGLNVTLVDFVGNCLDEKVREKLGDKFLKCDLERRLPIAAEYGFCTDVMEHIPPDKVDLVINNILLGARYCYFGISTKEDVCGSFLGEGVKLHLSLHDYDWWLEQFKKRDCKILWSLNGSDEAYYYVSAWQDGQTIVDHGSINETNERIKENVKHNCQQHYTQVTPHLPVDVEVMILGGGPSLNKFLDEIKENRASGAKLVTMNGAYNWAVEHGLRPSATVCVDAREFNARFTKPVIDDCKYLLSSQCHPSVFLDLPKERVFLWHTTTEFIQETVRELYPNYWPIPGGSTVLLRTLPLLSTLGYRKFILYGCDSCIVDDEAHAYSQPENDKDIAVPVIVGGKTFKCTPWMAAQATEFISLVRAMGEEVQLEIKGEGLIAWIIEYAASFMGEPIQLT